MKKTKSKKSFILYCDMIGTIDHLTDSEKGQLFQHLLEYVNGMNPVLKDRILLGVWKHIEQQLKRDLDKWSESKTNRSNNGKLGNLKRWNKDLYDKVISESMTLAEAETMARDRKLSLPDSKPSQEVAKIAVNDNATVNVNDNVINNNIPCEGIDFDKLLDFIKKETGKKFKVINESVKNKYRARFKEGYTKQDITNAVINACKDTYHKETKFKYLTPDYFSRQKTLDLHGFKEVKKEVKHLDNPYKGHF